MFDTTVSVAAAAASSLASITIVAAWIACGNIDLAAFSGLQSGACKRNEPEAIA
jgi:hypothetical protein